jgi:hypothetical protein
VVGIVLTVKDGNNLRVLQFSKQPGFRERQLAHQPGRPYNFLDARLIEALMVGQENDALTALRPERANVRVCR